MSLNNLKSDLLEILDSEPLWIKCLSYNPIRNIIKTGKTYHLLGLLKDVFGIKNNNPIISNIKYFHYKESYVDKIYQDLGITLGKVENIGNENKEMEIISLLAKIDYFKAYNKKYTDLLVKEIIQTNLFDKITILSHKAMLIALIYRLGHGNIFLERYFKHLSEYQNDSGGWPINPEIKKVDLFSTLTICHVFSENNLWINKKFTIKAEEYLIENHLSKNQTNEELDRWNRIYTGYKKNNLFEGGSVILLESLLLSNREANLAKIKSIISWLKSLQLKTGYFPYHSALKSQKNISSTIKILHLIKKYSLRN